MLTDKRELASIEIVGGLEPIEGADRIELATVRGWNVVVAKGDFQVGDQVLYCEVDAALPLSDPRFAFLAPRGAKTYGGQRVHVLKTIRLRGQYSQGLILPLAEFPELIDNVTLNDGETTVDDVLGIDLYEPPQSISSGNRIADFPGGIQKTDAERVQNIDDETWAEIQADNADWVPVEKVDGSSVTAFVDASGNLRVATRNQEIALDDTTAHGRAALSVGPLLEPGQWAQGEVCGPGINGNRLALKTERFFIFGFGRIAENRLPIDEWPVWTIPYQIPKYELKLPVTIAETIVQADGLKSLVTPDRLSEGIVWTHRNGKGIYGLGGRAVFKSVNNKYLLKG